MVEFERLGHTDGVEFDEDLSIESVSTKLKVKKQTMITTKTERDNAPKDMNVCMRILDWGEMVAPQRIGGACRCNEVNAKELMWKMC